MVFDLCPLSEYHSGVCEKEEYGIDCYALSCEPYCVVSDQQDESCAYVHAYVHMHGNAAGGSDSVITHSYYWDWLDSGHSHTRRH